MGRVYGPIRTVVDDAAAVVTVRVRASYARPEDGGFTVDDFAPVPFEDGEVNFSARAGVAVLQLTRPGGGAWGSGGRTTTLSLVIPEEDCTLEDAAKAAQVYDHVSASELSRIVGMIEATERNATAAGVALQGAEAAQGLAEAARDEAGVKAQAIFDEYHATRANHSWYFYGTGTPILSEFIHAKVRDFIIRRDPVSGDKTGEWRIDP